MELRVLLDILKRRKFLMLVTFSCTVTAAALISFSLTKVYEVVARVKIESRDDTNHGFTRINIVFIFSVFSVAKTWSATI